MLMYLEELVNKSYDLLNENDIVIWKYISTHKKECEKISIEDLAKKCFVSRTTVLRFAKRIGLKGFSELKVYLRLAQEEKCEVGDHLQIQKQYVEYMDRLSESDFTGIVEKIHKAENIYVYGHSAIQKTVALEMKRLFLSIRKFVFVLTSSGETEGFDENIHNGDLLFVISISGENDQMLDFVRRVRLKGVDVVAITSTRENSLIHLASEYITTISPKVINEYGSTVGCMAGYFILLDYLVCKCISSSKEDQSEC